MCQNKCRSSTCCIECADVEDTVIVAVVSKAQVVECTVCKFDRLKNCVCVYAEPCTRTCVECRIDEFDAVNSSLATEVEAVTTVTGYIVHFNSVIFD